MHDHELELSSSNRASLSKALIRVPEKAATRPSAREPVKVAEPPAADQKPATESSPPEQTLASDPQEDKSAKE